MNSDPVENASSGSIRKKPKSSGGSSAERPTVLVIDDDKKILEAFRIFLESEGVNIIAAVDVDDAMNKARANKIDLVISDFYLKTKSSVELYTLIRKIYPDIQIAVITGYPEYIGEEDVKIFGADHFFTKPLELDKLRELVRKYCFPEQVN
jgi:DNA-binding NtrC family response regulator